MKSPARVERAVNDIIGQINEAPDGNMTSPPAREALAILHALQWVRGKQMIPPEARVAQLMRALEKR